MIASHYAEPVERVVTRRCAAPLGTIRRVPKLRRISAPETRFLMLDDTLGWAWGYAGDERRVGYVRSDALSQKRS